MSTELISAIIAFVTSAGTALLAVYLHRRNDRNLEHDEVRKRKVEIVYQLLGSRYVLQESYPVSPEDAKVFNTAMCLCPAYFSADAEVTKAFDRFLGSKSDDNQIALLRVAAKSAGLDPLDSTLKRVLTVSPKLTPLLTPSDGFLPQNLPRK